MINNNPHNTRSTPTPSIILTTKRRSTVLREHETHHKSHRLALILAFAIVVPLFIFILIELIKQMSFSAVNYHFLSTDSALDLQVEVNNGDLVSIDFSKTVGITECILTPSISTKYILTSFNDNKKFYSKYYTEYSSYLDEEPKQNIKIGEYSPINTLICRNIRKEGKKIEVFKPIEIKSGILFYKQPVVPIDLEAKTHGNCIFLSGQKPINQDLICRAGDRYKNEEWEVLLRNKGIEDTVLYLPGTITQEAYFKPFELIKCGYWEQITDLECTSNISIESGLIGTNNESLNNVFLRDGEEIHMKVTKDVNKPISQCLKERDIDKDIDNVALVEDSLIEGAINCDMITGQSIRKMNEILGGLNKNESFQDWDNAKIKHFVSEMKLVINGERNIKSLEKIKKPIH
eukprot:GAHX01000923.1.p1 GENE.GAHX01000923.1~~GAHX01000923.1.p1  ORF type:complete len:404 (-),score=80.10 GAHX01000923.1:46-1257(-)